MTPPGGSGVSFVTPASSRVFVFTQVECPSSEDSAAGISPTTASSISFRGPFPSKSGVAPAAAPDDREAGMGGDEFPDRFLIIGDGAQPEQGDGAELFHGGRRVAMGVDEAGKDQLAAQVRDLRFFSDKAGDVLVRPDIRGTRPSLTATASARLRAASTV